MMDENDITTLEDMRKMQSRSNKSFKSVINSKNLSDDDLDDLFLNEY